MAETQEIDWSTINVDEGITKEEQAASDDISMSTPVGTFLCTIAGVAARENIMKAYTCYAANLKMQINRVIKVEQPVLNGNGKVLVRNGEEVGKIQPIPDGKQAEFDKQYVGRFIFDMVNLAHVSEKEATKKRRLFVAKKIGLITKDSGQLTGQMWATQVTGRQVVVTTDWNHWTDKSGVPQKNVKVTWDGYELASSVGVVTQVEGVGGVKNPDDFSGI